MVGKHYWLTCNLEKQLWFSHGGPHTRINLEASSNWSQVTAHGKSQPICLQVRIHVIQSQESPPTNLPVIAGDPQGREGLALIANKTSKGCLKGKSDPVDLKRGQSTFDNRGVTICSEAHQGVWPTRPVQRLWKQGGKAVRSFLIRWLFSYFRVCGMKCCRLQK